MPFERFDCDTNTVIDSRLAPSPRMSFVLSLSRAGARPLEHDRSKNSALQPLTAPNITQGIGDECPHSLSFIDSLPGGSAHPVTTLPCTGAALTPD